MSKYYDLNVLPIILNKFKVNRIVICGLNDKKTVDSILKYCEVNDVHYQAIDSNTDFDNDDVINDVALNVLPNIKDYDAIFLNDDPNWYTVYNELNIINDNNDEFPLVFICNNVFPHKRRDSYSNPNLIPNEFRQKYSKKLTYDEINIDDGFYHAIDDNTPNNGVLTAIEDFLDVNNFIEIMDIKLLNGITILYPKNTISQIRIGKIYEEINGFDLSFDDLSDNIVENQLLTNYLYKLNSSCVDEDIIDSIKMELNEKKKLIFDYENKINLYDDEINYKNSQIATVDSKLSLKNVQIKDFESKLLNKENKINNLYNQINSLKNDVDISERNFKNKKEEFDIKMDSANSQILSLKEILSKKEDVENNLNSQLEEAYSQIRNNLKILNDKNNQIKNKQNQIDDLDMKLNSIKKQYSSQLSKLDNDKYCISCFKEKIANDYFEIDYLKKNNIIKKILSPISYVYLIFKSKPKEIYLNYKLYNILKNSNCFDIGFYLNNNKDLIESKWYKYFSLELHYVCYGFDEERTFNKKYFNNNSKDDLFEYILNCNNK